MNTNVKPAPSLDLDIFARDYLLDPYPHHQRLRDAGPVVWLSQFGVWASGRFQEVQETMQNWRTFSSAAGVGLADIRSGDRFREPGLLIERDPPDHTWARQIVQGVLSPGTLAQLKSQFMAEAEALVDRALEAGELDGIASIAEAYPISVFADALGLPEDGRENLLPYARMVSNSAGPPNEIFRESVANGDRVVEWIMRHCRREALRPGGLGAKIFEAVDRGECSEDQGVLLVRSFLSAGLETTVVGLGNALYCFAANPDQWEVLRAEPGLLRNAFEEALRLETPFQVFFRNATHPTEIGGVEIAPDQRVALLLGAANRDPRRWSDPDRFDIRRRAGGHLAFGAGIHGCVGQMVARLEAEAVLTAMLSRVKTIELTDHPVHKPNNVMRLLDSLPIRLTPAR